MSETRNGELESERPIMSEESMHPALERLTEETAEAIMFEVGATPGDPKAAIMRLLRRYLEAVQAQEFQTALREQQREERDHQNCLPDAGQSQQS